MTNETLKNVLSEDIGVMLEELIKANEDIKKASCNKDIIQVIEDLESIFIENKEIVKGYLEYIKK